MTKENFTKLLDSLQDIYYQDDKESDAWCDFIKVLAPDSYCPIVEGRLSTVLSIIKIEYPEISDWLSYYFYEAKGMELCVVTGKDGKEYNYHNKEEVIQSMIDFGYIN